MPIQTALTVGSRVSYSDMANPQKHGTIVQVIPAGRYGGEQFRIQMDNGTERTSDCRQHGWNESHTVAPSEDELAEARAERAIEKQAREEMAAIPVIRFSMVETAKLIRKALKAAFPTIKFSVRISHSGSSTWIRWTDGPTTDQVKAVTGEFESEGFDGMQDMRTYAEPVLYLADDGSFVRHDYSSGLILEQRDFAPGVREHCAEICNLYDGGVKVDGYRLDQEVYRFLTKTDLTAIDYRTITSLYR